MHFRLPLGRLRTASRHWVRDRSGVAAIEFAFIGPLLVLMFVCLTDLGLGIYAKMQVNNAAQYGAQYALVNGYDASAITAAVKSSSDVGSLTVTPSSFCGCPGANGVLPTLTCGIGCTDGSTPGTYVRVSVTHSYATLIPYPGLPANFTLTSKSTARLK
jgi:Flp pilus assembly protein TadG